MLQRVAVICSGPNARVSIGFDNRENVQIYRLDNNGHALDTTSPVNGRYVLGAGVWAFRVQHPISIVGTASVLTTTGEDPWPKPPPPPPIGAQFTNFEKQLEALDQFLRG